MVAPVAGVSRQSHLKMKHLPAVDVMTADAGSVCPETSLQVGQTLLLLQTTTQCPTFLLPSSQTRRDELCIKSRSGLTVQD